MGRGIIQKSTVAFGLAGVAASIMITAGCDERVLVGNMRPIDDMGTTYGGGNGQGGSGTGGQMGTGGNLMPPGLSCSTISTQIETLNPCGHASGLAYSPDGTLLAVANMDSSAVPMWRLSDGALVRIFDGLAQTNYDLAFSPDGKTLAVVGTPSSLQNGPNAKLFDVASGALIRTLHTNSGFYADSVAFSPDGSLIATSGETNQIEVWHASDGSLAFTIPYQASVHNVHFSPSGTQLIAAGVDQRATIYNIPSGTLAMTLNGIADEMADATFSPDGTLVASTSSDGNGVKIWDAATGALLQTLSGHANFVSSVVWLFDSVIVSGDWQGNVIVWQRTNGTFALSRSWNTGGQVLGIGVSPDKSRIVMGAGSPNGFEFFLPLTPGP